MSNAQHDENGVPTLIGPSNADGITILQVQADPNRHRLSVIDGATGSDFGPANALKDANGVSTLMAVSSADGTTPVAVYVELDAGFSGHLLVDTQ